MSALLLPQVAGPLVFRVPPVMSAVVVPTDDHWYDALNPFGYLGSAAGKVVADGWTAAMLGLWNAGLWMLRLVLKIMDAFLTPDINGNGPGQAVYATTFWIAGALVVMLGMVQLGVAALRRDGRSLATVVIGVGQFAIVWSAWIAYGTAVVAACGGLTRALMQALLQVNSWSAWQPWSAFSTADITDGTVATVLGLLGMLLWLAAVGHLLVMLARSAALMVLVGTTPISAAGLVGEAGRSWFWKSLRWFHAAAFTPVLMVLVLGIGVQMTTGVANGLAGDKMQQAIGTAVPGVVLILIGCFAPLALFKLLAFVDPSTASGAAMRQGLAANGGLQGLLGGKGAATVGTGIGAGGGTSSAASSTDEVSRSAGESGAEDATTGRFQGMLGGLGTAGQAASKGLGVMASVGSKGAALGSDLTNQMGVGSHSYQPDFSGMGGSGGSGASGGSGGSGGQGPRGASPQADTDSSTDPGGSSNDDGRLDTGDATQALPSAGPGGPPSVTPPPPPTQPSPPVPAASGGGKGKSKGGPPAGGGGGAGGAAGGASGGAEAAAVVAV